MFKNKFPKFLLALLILPISSLFTLSFAQPNSDAFPNHLTDPNYNAVNGNTTYSLSSIENEANILPPNIYKKETGKLSFTNLVNINKNTTYTLVLFLKDGRELVNDKNVSKNGYYLQYVTAGEAEHQIITKEIKFEKSPSESLKEFENVNIEMFQPITMSIADDYSKIFVEINFIYERDSVKSIRLYKLDVLINNSQTSGIISQEMMYKGTKEDFKGYAEYNHAPYGLTNSMVGPYKDNSQIDIQFPFTNDTNNIINQLKSSLLAFDKGDYQYVDVEVYKDNFTEFYRSLNTKLPLTFQAKDSLGNSSKITFNIIMRDIEKPTITQIPEKIKFSYKTKLTKQDILQQFEIKDNYSYQPNVEITGIEFDKINQIGTYPIKLTVSDSSNNIETYQTEIQILDDIPPTIEGPDTINTTIETVLSSQDILDQFEIKDEIDTSTKINIDDSSYQNNCKSIGKYSVKIKAIDISGNSAEKVVTINVSDTSGPVFYINKDELTYIEGETIDTNNLLYQLIQLGYIPNSSYISAKLTSNEIDLTNKLTSGKYNAILEYTNSDLTKNYLQLKINVIDKFKSSTPSFLDKIIEFIKSFFNKLGF